MSTAEQKTVVIGISGCIAAYKSCEILRGLQKAGVRVKVVMTQHATHFVDPHHVSRSYPRAGSRWALR